MNPLLEDLWASYQLQKPIEANEARQSVFEELISCEGEVKENFTERQIEILRRYKDCFEGLASIDEREAFASGVRLATQYLLLKKE